MSKKALEALSIINIRGELEVKEKSIVIEIIRDTTRALLYMESKPEKTEKYDSIKLYYKTLDLICEALLHTDFSNDGFVSGSLLVCNEIHEKYSV